MRGFLLALPALVAANQEQAKNAAIQKVIEMLGEMEARGKKEKQEEEVAFAKFSTWCSDTKADKDGDIEASKLAITQFKAQIESAQAEADQAQAAIDDAVSVQEKMKSDIEAITKVRAEENAAYNKEKTDLQDSIYACDKAIEVLSSVPQQVEASQGEAKFFLQLKKSASLNRHTRTLLELVQAAQDPFVSATERKSDTVIEMISKLKEDFSQELQDKNKAEMESNHQYDMKKQESEQNAAAAAKKETESREVLAEAQANEGTAKKNLDVEEKSLKDDKKYLAEVTADCTQKAKDFKSRQKSRAEELTAIAEAISIMKSPEIQKGTGHLNKAQSVGSFVQVRSFLSHNGPEKVADFLRSRGKALGSKILVQIAAMAAADPFVKVRKMVQELINRLQEEAKAELTKKGKCDKDMAENKAKVEEYNNKVKKLTTEIEMLSAEIGELKGTQKRLTKELAQLKKAVAQARTDRASEKAENEKVISESTAASEAVDQAMTVLQGYYSKVEGAFVQVSQPEFEGGEYTGMGGGGVLGLLSVIKSQMDQLVRETTTAESDASTSHSDFMKQSEVSIATKSTLKKSTEETLAQKKEDLTDKKDALNGDDGAKNMLDQYVKEKNEVIDPVCVAKGVSFEERNKKREDEIASLEQALEILSQTEA